jgi:hypothetical protein
MGNRVVHKMRTAFLSITQHDVLLQGMLVLSIMLAQRALRCIGKECGHAFLYLNLFYIW